MIDLKTCVLDLDNTLVSTSFTKTENASCIFTYLEEDDSTHKERRV